MVATYENKRKNITKNSYQQTVFALSRRGGKKVNSEIARNVTQKLRGSSESGEIFRRENEKKYDARQEEEKKEEKNCKFSQDVLTSLTDCFALAIISF